MAVKVYKCPQCAASLAFNAETQKLDCKFCLGSFTISQVEELNAEQKTGGEEAPWSSDTSENTGASDEDFQKNARVYSCPDCGAEIVTDATTAATFCVFCHNPTIFPSQLSGAYKPSKVIPFTVDKAKAVEAFKKWCGKKPLVPAAFKAAPQLEKITGMYIPFWLYDCHVNATVSATAQTVRSWTQGDYRYTETKHFEVYRDGCMSFHNVPADGSSKMDDFTMDLLEPYDYSKLKPFSMSFLSGYLAEKYDKDKDDVFPRILSRVQTDARTHIMGTINGYTSVQVRNENAHVTDKAADYALLPLWMLIYKHGDKKYMFAMNGQTGKVVGKLPISKERVFAWLFGLLGGLYLIMLAGGMFL